MTTPTPYPRHVLLMSGGTDSLCVWHHLVAEERINPDHLLCVFMQLGQPWEPAEFAALLRVRYLLSEAFGVVVPLRLNSRLFLGDRVDPVTSELPLRNDLMVRLAALEGARTIYMGSLKDDRFRDHMTWWRDNASGGLTFLLDDPVEVRAPLKERTKPESVAAAARDPRLHAALLATRSCYRLTSEHVSDDPLRPVGCGECRACQRRREAFAMAALPPQRYGRARGPDRNLIGGEARV